jgi:apolipoprotein N-acyltransferase
VAADSADPETVAQRVGIATPICFEDGDPPLCRWMVHGESGAKRAPLLINLTNDGWFAGSNQPWQHMQIATLRCIENRVPMARSVNRGVSGFVDSLGRVRQVVTVDGQAQNVAGVATARVPLDRRRTWYSVLGAIPMSGIALITALLILGGWLRTDKIGR